MNNTILYTSHIMNKKRRKNQYL